ncbi:T9SS type A sorting domain-containing protein [Winogradskyella sp. PG-2]|uniref:T9SS type A sorting domain-containing protein n=1 Tax=Winogradskyella sp. PG-2 TaxID=754409 RepID=UPI000458700A|nr:T9SS type A sorting domain-containing protein [Winogradskyella sp. PG-2]BAO74986.1 hypothetical protein WPG_0756 [Winogradskyella sp. PG-2]
MPTHGDLTISKKDAAIGNVRIFDIQGQLLQKQHIQLSTTVIDVSHYSSGVYILKTDTANFRFIVNN